MIDVSRCVTAIVVRPSPTRSSVSAISRFGARVQRGRRLVEQEDRRIAQQRTRDREPLSLTTGQPPAAFADERVVAAWQGLDEVVELGGARRPRSPRRWHQACPMRDVLADRRVEQERVLEHDAELAAE